LGGRAFFRMRAMFSETLVNTQHSTRLTPERRSYTSLFHSQRLNNNTCHFPNCQKIFQQYKTKSGRYVKHIQQPLALFTDIFVDFHLDTALFRTFANPLEASYENAEPTLQLELIGTHCSDNFGLNSKKAKNMNSVSS
jgi:hypothetical protein